MTTITLELPDELATRVAALQGRLPQLLEQILSPEPRYSHISHREIQLYRDKARALVRVLNACNRATRR